MSIKSYFVGCFCRNRFDASSQHTHKIRWSRCQFPSQVFPNANVSFKPETITITKLCVPSDWCEMKTVSLTKYFLWEEKKTAQYLKTKTWTIIVIKNKQQYVTWIEIKWEKYQTGIFLVQKEKKKMLYIYKVSLHFLVCSSSSYYALMRWGG